MEDLILKRLENMKEKKASHKNAVGDVLEIVPEQEAATSKMLLLLYEAVQTDGSGSVLELISSSFPWYFIFFVTVFDKLEKF